MARIVSKLNLNKTPQLVESNSMIFAKNIKLLKDGSIGQDDSIVELSDLALNGFKIVGIIPYNTKFYILLHKEAIDGNPAVSAIWQYDEKTSPHVTVCNCNWNYSGGIIDGTCVVNLNGDILLNIIEYKEDDSISVPIKTINITESLSTDDESIYTQLPKIPLYNLSFVEYYNNNIPAGVYQFFIRYEIRDNFYTNWFPASKELFAGAKRKSLTNQGYLKYIDDSIDSGISFHLGVDKFHQSSIPYKSFQIGFILSHDEAVIARSWKHFPMNTTDIFFDYDNEYIEEIGVEEIISTAYGLYNVKNLTSFKNKLYISNYIESDFNPKLDSNINPELVDFLEEEGIDHELKNVKIRIATKDIELPFNIYNYTDHQDIEHAYKIDIVTDSVGDYYVSHIYNEVTNLPIAVSEIVGNILDDPHFTQYVDAHSSYDTQLYNIEELGIDFTYILSSSGEKGPQILNTELYYIYDSPFEDGQQVYPHNPGTFTDDYNDIIDYIKNKLLYFGRTGEFYDSLSGYGSNVNKVFYITRFFDINNKSYCTYKVEFFVKPEGIVLADDSYNDDIYTLMPGQSYKYYIHFVKETGEYTNGYFVGENTIDFQTYKDDIEDHKIIYPKIVFKSNLPSAYVACFISIIHSKTNTSELFDIRGKYANNIDFDVRLYADYDKLNAYDVTDSRNAIATYYASYDSTNFSLFGSKGKMDLGNDSYENHTMFVTMPFESNEDYSQLTKLTPYIFPIVENNIDYEYDNYKQLNLQSYICNVFVLADNFNFYIAGDEIYKKLLENDAISVEDLTEEEFRDWINYKYAVNYDDNNNPVNYKFTIYSNYNLNYLTLVNDLTPKILRKTFGEGENKVEVSGFSLHNQSMTLSEVYELKAMFKTYTRKLYQVYNKDAITKFDNTVRSSILEGDEAKINIFKFNSVDYYNVPTDKGIIINLKAVGEAIIVHTEDSIYKFTGANSLTAVGGEDVAMKEGEPFDTGIQEIFGSEFGFAGMQKKHHHVITENGYTFYDSDSNSIYIFGGQQQCIPISDDISKLLKYKEIVDIRFGNDYYNDRIFISIKFVQNYTATLSFNFRVKSFISLHDFTFDKAFHTKTNCYFYDDNKIYLVKHTTSRTRPSELAFTDNIYPQINDYNNINSELSDICTNPASIVDIIFKEDYSSVKTLNAISWVCSKIVDFISNIPIIKHNMAEEYNIPYTADFIRIYSDSTCTDLVQLIERTNDYALRTNASQTTPAIKLDELKEGDRLNYPSRPFVNYASYKYPRYNLGKWTWNYFRNILNQQDASHPEYTTNSISDNQSLIYGKYIVVRFIFNNNANFKLEDIEFNIN